jgi:hypothetical protein
MGGGNQRYTCAQGALKRIPKTKKIYKNKKVLQLNTVGWLAVEWWLQKKKRYQKWRNGEKRGERIPIQRSWVLRAERSRLFAFHSFILSCPVELLCALQYYDKSSLVYFFERDGRSD